MFSIEKHLAGVLGKAPVAAENVAEIDLKLKVEDTSVAHPAHVNHEALKASFKADLLAALKIAPEMVAIDSVQANTIAMKFRLMGPNAFTTQEMVGQLCEQQGDPDSILYKGSVTKGMDRSCPPAVWLGGAPVKAFVNASRLTQLEAERDEALEKAEHTRQRMKQIKEYFSVEAEKSIASRYESEQEQKKALSLVKEIDEKNEVILQKDSEITKLKARVEALNEDLALAQLAMLKARNG